MKKIIFLFLIALLYNSISAYSQGLFIENNPYDKADDLTRSKKSFNRERWFYEQRMFPNNYIPEDALAKAIDQRNEMRNTLGFALDPLTTWRNIGPTPGYYFSYTNVSGRITSVKYDPVNPNIVYLGAAFGGVWKSTNGGNNFVPITDKEISMSSGSIFIDPSNPNIIYYGTGEATYSGVSYYGRGILKSTNGGDSWRNYYTGLPSLTYCSRLIIRPGFPNILFAAMGTAGLFTSTNAGETWSQLLTGRCDDIIFSPNGTTAYIVGSGTGYRKSTDGGITFSPNTSLTMGIRNHIALCRDNPSVLYSSVYTGYAVKVYKSTNSGNNFSQIAVNHDFNADQAWYNFYMHVNPFNPNYAYVGLIDIWRTTNGGTNFQNITNSYFGGIVHADQHNMDFNPQNSNELMAVNDGGIWKSTNSGNNWINLNSGLSLTQFYTITSEPTNAGHLIGGTQDNGTQRTLGTSNWTSVISADGGEVCFHSQNPYYILGERQYNGILLSTDGGNSWEIAETGLTGASAWIAPIISHPTASGVFYTAREKVFKTTNWGLSWNPISSGIVGIHDKMAISKSNPSIMYVSSGYGIFKSTNGGNNFFSVTTGLQYRYISSISIHPDSSNTVLLTYSGFGTGKIYKTTNGGSFWSNISGNLPDTPVNDLLIYHPGISTSIYYAAMDAGVFYTDNYGQNWIELADSLPNTIAMHLDYHQSTNLIRVATHGRGVWEIGNPIGIVNYNNEVPKNFSLQQNFPNPFNPVTMIKYDIIKEGYVKLAVYDILGKELRSIVNENQKAGTYTAQFDGSNLTSGVYFYRLITNGFTETRKMMMVK
jgi:photosystem II stability/assembly factor-like uncharacterized protein